MELDIINRLFLELAQVTTATTDKELRLQRDLEAAMNNQSDTHVWATSVENKLRDTERELAAAQAEKDQLTDHITTAVNERNRWLDKAGELETEKQELRRLLGAECDASMSAQDAARELCEALAPFAPWPGVRESLAKHAPEEGGGDE